MQLKMIDVITDDACQMFDIDETDMFNLKLNYGLNYITDHFSHDQEVAQALTSNAAFWLWWRERWAVRDKSLLLQCEKKRYGIHFKHHIPERYTQCVFNPDVFNLYTEIHDWRKVEFYPTSTLISQCLNPKEKPFKQLIQ